MLHNREHKQIDSVIIELGPTIDTTSTPQYDPGFGTISGTYIDYDERIA